MALSEISEMGEQGQETAEGIEVDFSENNEDESFEDSNNNANRNKFSACRLKFSNL